MALMIGPESSIHQIYHLNHQHKILGYPWSKLKKALQTTKHSSGLWQPMALIPLPAHPNHSEIVQEVTFNLNILCPYFYGFFSRQFMNEYGIHEMICIDYTITFLPASRQGSLISRGKQRINCHLIKCHFYL